MIHMMMCYCCCFIVCYSKGRWCVVGPVAVVLHSFCCFR